LIDEAHYLKLLGKGINQVLQTPGRLVQSVAQASFDAWIKYYRPDENTPNATVSYYSKGALVALCLDLTLQLEGHTTLDAVMRALWGHTQGGPMTEQDLLDVLQTLGRRSYAKEIKAWVHSTVELPLRELLQAHGVAVHDDPAQLAQRLGLRVSEAQGVVVKTVLRGGAAEQAGMAPGDEWLGVRLASDKASSAGWRLNKLDDLLLYAGPARRLTALVSRDRRLLELPLVMPPDVKTWRLAACDAKRLGAWLGG
jgi:predicted metalloprotease with PDZ domain